MKTQVFAVLLAFVFCTSGAARELLPFKPIAMKPCCPKPFTQIGYECFYLSKTTSNWNDAREYCQEMGGDLAVPSNVMALFGFVFPTAGSHGVWIGGTDQGSEGSWTNYINGVPINPSDWSVGQPDDYAGREDCLELRRFFMPPLNDYVCRISQHFVCEVPCVSQIVRCPPPSTRLGNECFYVSNTTLNWNDARQFCLDMGAYLAIPSDVISFDNWVFTEAGGPGVWIGGTDQMSEGVWNYLNGDSIPDSVWSPGQPDNLGNEDCLEVRSYFDPPLNDYVCSRYQEFACEFEPL